MKFMAVCASLFIALLVLLSLTLLPASRLSIPPVRTLSVHPGDPFPPQASCGNQYPSYIGGREQYCSLGQDAWFTYDIEDQAVVRVTYSVSGITIGRLIVVWGIPESRSSGYIYWSDGKFAYAGLLEGPNDAVLFIGLDSKVNSGTKWRGFSTH